MFDTNRICSPGDRGHDGGPGFQKFKRQLYHASIAAVLRTLLPGMSAPVVYRCPDGHFRRVIYDLVAFIADYPEQVLLTGIVQGWCPRCTRLFHFILVLTISIRCIALPNNLDTYALPRTSEHTDRLSALYSPKVLWVEYGIDDDIIVSSFYST